VVVGYGFIVHGYAKLSRGPSGFAAILQALDVPVPDVMAWATILVELVGGFAVILGAFVWIASIPLAVVLLVAMFTVHLPYGFSSIKLVAVTAAGAQFGPPGYEANLLYLASLAALVLGGSGRICQSPLIAAVSHARCWQAASACGSPDDASTWDASSSFTPHRRCLSAARRWTRASHRICPGPPVRAEACARLSFGLFSEVVDRGIDDR
jgi:putative oxidoreductase